MKKPLPVRIVEAIGWAYVACVALIMVLSMLFSSAPCTGAELIGGFIVLSLPLSMVFSLRTGQRFGFVVPNTVMLSAVIVVPVAAHLNQIGLSQVLIWAILPLIIMIVPEVLLCRSSSRLWLKEKAVESTKGRGRLCTMAIRILPVWPVVLLVLYIFAIV